MIFSDFDSLYLNSLLFYFYFSMTSTFMKALSRKKIQKLWTDNNNSDFENK